MKRKTRIYLAALALGVLIALPAASSPPEWATSPGAMLERERRGAAEDGFLR